ncbi:MAG TPA: hypothetical protein DD784_05700 [Ruminococcaceae bacterium]|nr:hypothetical protein [Oscillospiraceae bacterium]
MKRNKRNEVILFCVAALICGAVIAICISVSMKNHSSESGSSTGEASQTSEMTSGTTSSVTEPVITEPEPIQTLPAESEDTSELETRPDDPTADMVVTSAASLIGTDFVDGGETPEQGFDNSGFIYYVLRENGYITCPRGVSKQSEMGQEISYEKLRRGDLVFFSESGTVAEFGGIYAGDGKMIACLMPGTKVKEVDITTGYYTKNFFRGVAIS